MTTYLRYHDENLETMSGAEIADLQWSKLGPLLQQVWDTNPFYRDRWQSAGVDPSKIKNLEDFRASVPTVDKAAFMADQEAAPPFGLRHEPILNSRKGHIPITTSGSSGQGVEIHLQTQEDVANHNALNHFYFRWSGLEPGDIVFLMMHVSLLAGGRCEYHAAVDYGLSVYPVAMHDTAKRVELIQKFRPKGLIATTSYLGHLAAKSGVDLSNSGISAIFCGAESASPKWFQRLETSFGAKAYDRYGLSQMATDHMFTCERGVGTDDNPGVLHNIDPYVLLEVIDPESGEHVADGERGEIVLTSLYRSLVPVVRCRTNDSAIYRAPGSCDCGRGFSGIQAGSVQRIDDVKKVKGINIWPQAMDEAMFSFPEVRDYRVTLTSDATEADVGIVEFLVADGSAPEGLERQITTHLRNKIGIGFEVRAVAMPFPEAASQKKQRWIEKRHHVLEPTVAT
jgi:phenylacetate-CoA ligase